MIFKGFVCLALLLSFFLKLFFPLLISKRGKGDKGVPSTINISVSKHLTGKIKVKAAD